MAPHCESKMLYSNRKLAAAAARNLERRIFESTRREEPIIYYRCTEGHHGYHLGHPLYWRASNNTPRPAIKVSL